MIGTCGFLPSMNIKNALGFFVLGLLMHTTPVLAQSFSADAVVGQLSVRSVWLELMSWVIGGIGCSYLVWVGMQSAQDFILDVVSARLLRLSEEMPAGQIRFQTAVRVSITY